jgi:hypothetical protein
LKLSIATEPQIMAPRVTPLEGVSTYARRGIGVRGVENPQGFGIDERRFIESGIQRLFVTDIDCNLINSPQRAQSSQRLILPFGFERGKILQPRNGTRMTRIGRIFTDLCVSVSSAQSVFYCSHSRVNPHPAFISVHSLLINCFGGA